MNDRYSNEQLETEALTKWNSDPALRAEFCNNRDAWLAFCRAEARGLVHIIGGKVRRPEDDER